MLQLSKVNYLLVAALQPVKFFVITYFSRFYNLQFISSFLLISLLLISQCKPLMKAPLYLDF